MVKRFSTLTKSKTQSLHKDIAQEYKEYSPHRLDEEYGRLKKRHDELKFYLDKSKEIAADYKRLREKAQSAKSEVARAESAALNNMSALQTLGSFFSSKKIYSPEHASAVEKQNQISKEIAGFKRVSYASEIQERKLIYHKLKVISEIRAKHKEERIRSLANAQVSKVRAASSSLKKRAVRGHGSTVECVYCTTSNDKSDMVLDHIYPVAEGGLDTERNTVLVCFECNSRKSDLTLRAFTKKYKLDYSAICDRLDRLKKNV
jgi:5-methylcytosine-specific restriction endonuclease McrA